MERIKHFNYKCPFCDNDDFIQIKTEGNSRVLDIEDKLEIYGCTKCSYLITFNKQAVAEVLAIEKERERLFHEIDKIKQEVVRLEEEYQREVDKLGKLVENMASEKEISELRNVIENDIKERIKILNSDIKRLENGDEDLGCLPTYSNQDGLLKLHSDEIQELFKRVNNIKEYLESF